VASGVLSSSLAQDGADVLQYVHTDTCKILTVRPALQAPGIAALLDRISDHKDEGGSGFLVRLLGAEKTQAALAAVLQGTPHT